MPNKKLLLAALAASTASALPTAISNINVQSMTSAPTAPSANPQQPETERLLREILRHVPYVVPAREQQRPHASALAHEVNPEQPETERFLNEILKSVGPVIPDTDDLPPPQNTQVATEHHKNEPKQHVHVLLHDVQPKDKIRVTVIDKDGNQKTHPIDANVLEQDEDEREGKKTTKHDGPAIAIPIQEHDIYVHKAEETKNAQHNRPAVAIPIQERDTSMRKEEATANNDTIIVTLSDAEWTNATNPISVAVVDNDGNNKKYPVIVTIDDHNAGQDSETVGGINPDSITVTIPERVPKGDRPATGRTVEQREAQLPYANDVLASTRHGLGESPPY